MSQLQKSSRLVSQSLQQLTKTPRICRGSVCPFLCPLFLDFHLSKRSSVRVTEAPPLRLLNVETSERINQLRRRPIGEKFRRAVVEGITVGVSGAFWHGRWTPSR
jgi:hypothetical protein